MCIRDRGKDIPLGLADVVVTDGFTGNVAAKLSEGLIMALAKMLKAELTSGWLPRIGALLLLPGLIISLPGALLLMPGLKSFIKRLNPDEVGGAPLLGVRGPVIIAHGRSNAKAMKNAVRVAAQTIQGDMVGAIRAGLSEMGSVFAVEESEEATAG